MINRTVAQFLRGIKLTFTLCFLFIIYAYSQDQDLFFRDTVQRSHGVIIGAQKEGDQFIYFWGSDVGWMRTDAPMLRKVDAEGNLIWDLGSNPNMEFSGAIHKVLEDGSYLYLLGTRNNYWGEKKFFLAKVDKVTGNVIFRIENTSIDIEKVFDFRNINTEQLRVITVDGNQVNAYFISKGTGIFDRPVSYGRYGLVPEYIDNNDFAYYIYAKKLNNKDVPTIGKFDTKQSVYVWETTLYAPNEQFLWEVPSMMLKDDGILYMLRDRSCQAIDDTGGTIKWFIKIPSKTSTVFSPTQVSFLEDTLYISWGHDRVGSITEFARFSKINKKDGKIYLDGNIEENGGIKNTGNSYVREIGFTVSSSGTIYLFGSLIFKQFTKTISGNGELLNETRLHEDMITDFDFKILDEPFDRKGNRFAFIINNKPTIITTNTVYNQRNKSGSKPLFYQLDLKGNNITRKYYDNNYYQIPSSVVDIQTSAQHTFILKRQGANVILEKRLQDFTLVWEKNLINPDSCFFVPISLAVDSLENTCIIGSTQYSCFEPDTSNTLIRPNSFKRVNKIFTIDKDGKTLTDVRNEFFILERKSDINLVGGEDRFYIIASGDIYTISSDFGFRYSGRLKDYEPHEGYIPIIDYDSLRVFMTSEYLNSKPYYLVMKPGSGGKIRKVPINSLPKNSDIITVLKSTFENNIVYILATAELGSYYYVMKYNYLLNKAKWISKFEKTWKGELIPFVLGRPLGITEDIRTGQVYVCNERNQTRSGEFKVYKLDKINGEIIWTFNEAGIDVTGNKEDINNMAIAANGDIVIVGVSQNQVLKPSYYSSIVELRADNGQLSNVKNMGGVPGEPTAIEIVKAMPGSGILVGGYVNGRVVGGKNGFIFIRGKLFPACNMTASFDYSDSGNGSGEILFNNKSISSVPAKYIWDFGDTQTDTSVDPKHTYTQSGSYTICLKMTDEVEHCSSTICDTIQVKLSSGRIRVNPNPVQDIIQLILETDESDVYIISVFDLNGRKVVEKQMTTFAGHNKISLPATNLKKGGYIVEGISSKGKRIRTRFVRL